jgi:hypothetical protein
MTNYNLLRNRQRYWLDNLRKLNKVTTVHDDNAKAKIIEKLQGKGFPTCKFSRRSTRRRFTK